MRYGCGGGCRCLCVVCVSILGYMDEAGEQCVGVWVDVGACVVCARVSIEIWMRQVCVGVGVCRCLCVASIAIGV